MNAAFTFGPLLIVKTTIKEDAMTKSSLHEFHFIIDSDMKQNLRNISIYKTTGSISGTIVKIFSLLIPVLEREHKWGEQRLSRYMPVHEDVEINREHVHAYIPTNLYRRMKLMHQDLNFYSIAQLLREFLNLFINMVKEFGNNIYKELKKLFNQWEMEKKETMLSPRKFIRQLHKIIQHLHDKNKLINLYSRDFSPFWMFRL